MTLSGETVSSTSWTACSLGCNGVAVLVGQVGPCSCEVADG